MFSLFYHDIIYKVTAKDNEEKSALAAIKNLELLHYPKEKIKACGEMIIATKSHEISTDSDTNIFTDVDLSILGSSSEAYKEYSNQVRQEYSIFPDFIYYPGRKKVLEHFLKMENIFKTQFFKGKFEDQAKRNISTELSLLT